MLVMLIELFFSEIIYCKLFLNNEQLQSLEIAKLSISNDIAKFYGTVLLLLTVKTMVNSCTCEISPHYLQCAYSPHRKNIANNYFLSKMNFFPFLTTILSVEEAGCPERLYSKDSL